MSNTRRKAIGNDSTLSEPPTFSNPEDERQYRKQRLAAGFRIFAHCGFAEGIAGHISARDPEHTDSFWVNPFGMHFSQIRASDLIRINHAGQILEGTASVNGAAFAIHSRIHAQHPQVIAVAHSHSIYGKSWASLGRQLDPITQDACAFYQNHAVFDQFTGVVIDTSTGDRIAEKLAGNKALILQNHGLLTVGGSIDSAVYLYLSMERCCQSQLMAEAAGTPKLIDDKVAKATRDYISSEHSLWFSFQPMYNFIVTKEPELLQ